MKSRLLLVLVLCSLCSVSIGNKLTLNHGKNSVRRTGLTRKSDNKNNNKTPTSSAKQRNEIMTDNFGGPMGFPGNGFGTGFAGEELGQGVNFPVNNDLLNGGFQGDMAVGGYHGYGSRQYHHREGAHPNVELTQNVYKADAHHVFDGGPKHMYGGLTKHVPPPQRGPIHVVQGKQIEITTKPQHIDVHFYEYDKHGKQYEREQYPIFSTVTSDAINISILPTEAYFFSLSDRVLLNSEL